MSSLKEYSKKRNFSVTPEPIAELKQTSATRRPLKPGQQGAFFIQRHDASHLHYDFRLEMEGTLKSWAVPKGPSLDPGDKRLAMMVEDHPISYGTFEGNIPQGQYGGGSVMLWDQGIFTLLGSTTSDKQVAEGDLKFSLTGSKLNGEFALVRLRQSKSGKEWLLIKKKDEHAQPGWSIERENLSILTGRDQEGIAKGAAPEGKTSSKEFEPMLAMLADVLPEGDSWVYEVKWDGMRAICQLSAKGIQFHSRTGGNFSRHFPELAGIAKNLKAKEAVVDGEIVAVDERGVSHFEWLQPRFADPKDRPAKQQEAGQILYCVFDLLSLNGKDLRDQPLAMRYQMLLKVLAESEVLKVSQHFSGKPQDVLRAAAELGIEGVIAKRIDSKYSAGRSQSWRKFKIQMQQEFLICGWLEGKRKPFGSLVLGVYDQKGLKWCGNVGTGFDESMIHKLFDQMSKRRISEAHAGVWPKGMVAIEPGLVCEVRFSQWTNAGRLRAPVFLGLRQDVRPSEVRKESAADGLLLSGTSDSASIEVDGNKLELTNLNKIYFPEDGITKRDVLNYYSEISPYLLPLLQGRPLSLRRYPDGIHGKSFFQKNLPDRTPKWIQSVEIRSAEGGRKIRYCICDQLSTLLYLVNLGCIDHNPWMSRHEDIDSPDFLLIDLDANGVAFSKVVEAAFAVKELLEEVALSPLVKTSGGDGLHLLIPLEARQSYARVRAVAEQIAAVATSRYPKLLTMERFIARRPKGRVYFDHVQIGKGKTVASAYSIRPYPKAPVSTPLRWQELAKVQKPEAFHIGNTLDRLKRIGHIWSETRRYQLG